MKKIYEKKFWFLILSGIFSLFVGFDLVLKGGLYRLTFDFLRNLRKLPLLSSLTYLSIAERLFGVRFAPSDFWAGLFLLLLGLVFLLAASLSKSEKEEPFKEISPSAFEKFYKPIALALALVSVFFLFRNFDWPIARINSFKQTEVASNIYCYVRDGFKIEETLLAKNQELRLFSYPFYQWPVAALSLATGLKPDQSGRLVNIVIFLLTFAVYAKILRRLEVEKPLSLAILALFSFSPLILYYYRSVHPDPLAVFLTFLSLDFFLDYDDGKKKSALVWSLLLGVAAVLIKSPTYFIAAGGVVFYRYFRFGLKGVLKKDLIVYSLTIILAVVFYKITADAINRGIALKTPWIFGTLKQRLSISEYLLPLTWHSIELSSPIFFVFAAVGFLSKTRRAIEKKFKLSKADLLFLSLAFSSLAALFLFFNVYKAHDYYQLPMALPEFYFASVVAVRLAKNKSGAFSAFKISVLALALLASFAVFKMSNAPDWNLVASGEFVREKTPPDAFVFYIVGEKTAGWDPSALYFARRDGYNLSPLNFKKPLLAEIARKFPDYKKRFLFVPRKLFELRPKLFEKLPLAAENPRGKIFEIKKDFLESRE